MEYRTTIEITSEAENPLEAADIAGEYLRGNIDANIRMRCRTRPLKNNIATRIILIALVCMGFIGLTSFKINKTVEITSIISKRNISAIQPPLRSGLSINDSRDAFDEKNR